MSTPRRRIKDHMNLTEIAAYLKIGSEDRAYRIMRASRLPSIGTHSAVWPGDAVAQVYAWRQLPREKKRHHQVLRQIDEGFLSKSDGRRMLKSIDPEYSRDTFELRILASRLRGNVGTLSMRQ